MDYNHKKKILILGDTGRSKGAFAEKLSKKLGIPHHHKEKIVKLNSMKDIDKYLEAINQF